MDVLKAIFEAMKESLKKRREFEKTYRDANSAFLGYVYPDRMDSPQGSDGDV